MLDTNVYIKALRNANELALLRRFLLRVGMRLRVNAVVAMELRMGARTEAQADAVDALMRPYSERDRVIVPSFEAYLHAGRVVSALKDASGSLINDALLAASCREQEVMLITENARDFSAIQRHLRGFRFETRLTY